MRKTIATLTAAIALVGLAGCSSNDDGNGTSTTPTTETATSTATTAEYPRSGLQTYETVEQLHSDLQSGVVCTNFERYDRSVNAASSGQCDVAMEDGSSRQLIVMLFSSDVNKQSQIGVYRDVGDTIGKYGFVEGGNWLVNCETLAVCEAVAGALGGRVETLPMF